MITKPYDVLLISLYVINASHYIDSPISNLKLQKLLYYIQATFLVLKNQRCFNSKIVAWGAGPAVPEVYVKFKKYADNFIPEFICTKEEYEEELKLNKILHRPRMMLKGYENCISVEDLEKIKIEDRELIDSVVLLFKNCSSAKLSEISMKTIPWKKSYKVIKDGGQAEEIKCVDIYEYFKDKIERINS